MICSLKNGLVGTVKLVYGTRSEDNNDRQLSQIESAFAFALAFDNFVPPSLGLGGAVKTHSPVVCSPNKMSSLCVERYGCK